MTGRLLAFEIPEPRSDDDDDVAWALQTAGVQWNREAYADTIVWLRRAEESAKSVGAHERAQQIDEVARRIADDMADLAARDLAARDSDTDVVTSAPKLEAFRERAPRSSIEVEVDVDLSAPLVSPPIPPPSVNLTTTQASQYQTEEVARARLRPKAPSERKPDVTISGRPPPPPRTGRPPPPPRPSGIPKAAPVPVDIDAELIRDTSVEFDDETITNGTAVVQALVAGAGRDSSVDALLGGPEPESSVGSGALVHSSELLDGAPDTPRGNVAEFATPAFGQHSASEAPVQDAPTLRRIRSATPTDLIPAAKRPDADVRDLMPTHEETTEQLLAYERPTVVQPESEAPASQETEPPPVDPTERKLTVAERARASSLPPSEPAPTPRAELPTPIPGAEAEPRVGGVLLAEVRGLEDLPEDAQFELAASAELLDLKADEEVNQFEVALVISGEIRVMPAVDDLVAATSRAGDVVFTTGSLEDGIALRVVAGDSGATVAVWKKGAISQATTDCPWVADELRQVADRLQSLAGAAMGLLGERLDEELRQQVTGRLDVRVLLPAEVIVEAGSAVPGLVIVGAGRLEVETDAGTEELLPGDFLLPAQILSAGKAPHTVRASPTGAVVLFGERILAHELLVSVPPLIELLSG